MNIVSTKCSTCGASIKIEEGRNSGICQHCGTAFHIYKESLNKQNLNRQQVLEKMLVKYYQGKFNDIDNIKEYSFKVLEIDSENPLANFVAFSNIDNPNELLTSITNASSIQNPQLYREIFKKSNIFTVDANQIITSIENSKLTNQEKAYVLLCLNDAMENSNIDKIFVSISQLNNVDKLKLLEKYLGEKPFYIPAIKPILEVIYMCKLSESNNNQIISILEKKSGIAKSKFAYDLIGFSKEHEDFYFYKANYEELGNKYYQYIHDKLEKTRERIKENLSKVNEPVFTNSNTANPKIKKPIKLFKNIKTSYNTKRIKKWILYTLAVIGTLAGTTILIFLFIRILSHFV